LVQHEVARQFFEAVVRQARQSGLMSAEHFTAHGRIEAWASLTSATQRSTSTARSGATRRTSRPRIRVPAAFDADALRRVIAAVEAR
jgi:hypothetical protein